MYCPDPDDLEVGQLTVGIWLWIISLNRVGVLSLRDLETTPLLVYVRHCGHVVRLNQDVWLRTSSSRCRGVRLSRAVARQLLAVSGPACQPHYLQGRVGGSLPAYMMLTAATVDSAWSSLPAPLYQMGGWVPPCQHVLGLQEGSLHLPSLAAAIAGSFQIVVDSLNVGVGGEAACL